MRIFLTIQFIAILLLLIGWGRDIKARRGYHSADDGWTTMYYYNVKKRHQAYEMTNIAAVLSIIGFLVIIWTY